MEHSEISFTPLLIVAVLAFLVPILLSRSKLIGVPVVVGEIVAGIVVGNSGLQIVQDGGFLEALSILGFAYLMFLSGLEIEFSDVLGRVKNESSATLRGLLANPFGIGITLFILTLIGSLVAGILMWQREMVQDPWIIAFILSTTSLGVVVPVLKERELTQGQYGQAILVPALVADFASILLISVYVVLRSQGLTLEILLILVLFLVFVVAHRMAVLFQRHLPTERILDELSSATSQVKLRGAFALALVFIALAEGLGIEIILGAFLAGVIISLIGEGEGSILRQKLDALGYGFFVPIFFIMVGVDFDLPALLASRSAVLLVPLLVGIAYLVKLIPALLYRVHFSQREALAAGALMSSRLSLIIAASAIGLELGLLSTAVNSAIILVAIATSMLSPVLFNRLLGERKRERDLAIIVGSRHGTELLAERLEDHDFDAVVLQDDNPTLTNRMTEDAPFIWSRHDLFEALRKASIEQASTVVAMELNDEDNLRICRIARDVYEIENVVVWAQDPALNDRYRDLGVRIMNPAYANVLMLHSMVLSPDLFSITADMDQDREVRQIKLQNPHLSGRRLDSLTIPEGIAILMIERAGDVLIPEKDTALRANDTLTLVGDSDDVVEFARLLSRDGRLAS